MFPMSHSLSFDDVFAHEAVEYFMVGIKGKFKKPYKVVLGKCFILCLSLQAVFQWTPELLP